ncbi:WD40-repeat-containing domain protein [Phlyctochytrium arcticum]|nr:WD40-repeat-containing domain protein [Phlyctochytrium arcticum]
MAETESPTGPPVESEAPIQQVEIEPPLPPPSASAPATTEPALPSTPTPKPPAIAKSRAASRAQLAKSSSRVASRANLKSGVSGADVRRPSVASTVGSVPGTASGKPSKRQAPPAAPASDDNASTADPHHLTTADPPASAGPATPPPGILPLFLTSMTQDLFKIRSGEDVTAEKPIKLIPKTDLMADLTARLAIGDFYPAKQAIMDFPGDEILVHYDADFKYGQNFYLCITIEAMDNILRELTGEAAPGGVAAAKKPIVSQKWESLGSEKEVESDWVVNNRDLIEVNVSRRRKLFNQQYKFGDRDAHDGFLECRPFKDPNFDIMRMEISTGSQAVPEVVESAVQTAWFRPLNFAAQYEPMTLSKPEQEAILSTNEISDFVESVAIRFEKALQQNSIVDIFEDDYAALGEEDVALEQGSQTHLQEYQSFTDLKHSKDRSISCTDWHPTIKGKCVVAISCTERMSFDERVERGLFFRSRRALILVWSFHDPIHPQLILEAPEDVLSFQFNPNDPNIIAGGCINGQVVLWDISEHHDKLKISRKTANTDPTQQQQPPPEQQQQEKDTSGTEKVTETMVVHWVAVSSIEASHRSGITDVQWLPRNMELSHSGEILPPSEHSQGYRQLLTASLDGTVAFWDTRSKKDPRQLDLVWRPFLRVPLSAMDNTFDYSLSKVCFRRIGGGDRVGGTESSTPPPKPATATAKDKAEAALFSKFYCSTEEGDLIYSDWVAEKASEEKASRVEHAYSYHFGPLSDVQRSPFFSDIILSTGGWSFYIWREGVTTGPLLASAPSSVYVICGRWSPTRPGVFYLSKADGSIEVWDLLDRSHSPSSVQNISGSPISSMSIRQYPVKSLTHNQFIAAGDDEGTLHILEVPRNLTRPNKNEFAFVRSFFDREVRRLGYVRSRKEFRIRERSKFEQAQVEALAAQVAAGARPVSARAAASGGSGGSGGSEDDEERLEAEYQKMERNFLEMEGLIPLEAS